MRGEVTSLVISPPPRTLKTKNNLKTPEFGMPVSGIGRPRRIVLAVTLIVIAAPAQAACDFAPVKQQTDTVIDSDAARFAIFRKEVSEGADPIAMMERLVAEDTRQMLDICRYEAGEYLTKRGFPPFH
jgi:hypothetical protein